MAVHDVHGLTNSGCASNINSGRNFIIGGYIGSFLGGLVTTAFRITLGTIVGYMCRKKWNRARKNNYAGEVVAKG